jgi:NCAIR mutase (PurE)-related protein
MTPTALQQLFEQVKSGDLTVAEAVENLRTLPFAGATEVLADTHRLIRQGFPEAVFAEGKTTAQVAEALSTLHTAQGFAMATRVSMEQAAMLCDSFADGKYDTCSRLFVIGQMDLQTLTEPVGVISAGTSDQPVAEEAAQTLEFGGIPVQRVRDIGVAGLHRLLARLDTLRSCCALIVVAGMEGALPGVIGGLVACPVIAVPTSIGYGTSVGGVAALLTMLSSCASGLTVVNIDNGYGAAIAVQRILRQRYPTSK